MSQNSKLGRRGQSPVRPKQLHQFRRVRSYKEDEGVKALIECVPPAVGLAAIVEAAEVVSQEAADREAAAVTLATTKAVHAGQVQKEAAGEKQVLELKRAIGNIRPARFVEMKPQLDNCSNFEQAKQVIETFFPDRTTLIGFLKELKEEQQNTNDCRALRKNTRNTRCSCEWCNAEFLHWLQLSMHTRTCIDNPVVVNTKADAQAAADQAAADQAAADQAAADQAAADHGSADQSAADQAAADQAAADQAAADQAAADQAAADQAAALAGQMQGCVSVKQYGDQLESEKARLTQHQLYLEQLKQPGFIIPMQLNTVNAFFDKIKLSHPTEFAKARTIWVEFKQGQDKQGSRVICAEIIRTLLKDSKASTELVEIWLQCVGVRGP